MTNNFYLPKRWMHQGQAALVTLFIIGMAALVLAMSFSSSGVNQVNISENDFAAKKAFYTANAGIEDLLVRLKQDSSLGASTYTTDQVALDEGSYIATISALNSSTRVATATGRFRDLAKSVEVRMATSSSTTTFTMAMQVGDGGVEMEQSARTECAPGACTEASVYSNGDIKGVKTSPLSSASKIKGNAWAYGNITQLNVGDQGVLVTGDASASGLLYCRVRGDQYETAVSADSNCPLDSGQTHTQTASGPPKLPMPNFDEDFWKSQATNSALGGSVFTGNCDVLSGGSDDCTNGTGDLGPTKITGDLNIDSGTDLNITGPVWVEGDIIVNSNNTISLDDSFVNYGTVVLSDGQIQNASNVSYTHAGESVLMMASLYNDGLDCGSPAIEVSSNSDNVVFYAINGCVNIAANSHFYGAIAAEKIHISNNSTVFYDPALSTAVFGSTTVGGWTITDWRELD